MTVSGRTYGAIAMLATTLPVACSLSYKVPVNRILHTMTGIERYGSSGAHTVEGNVAGSVAAKLTKQREKQQKDYETKREDIKKTHRRGTRIDANFQSHQDDDEREFKARFARNWQLWRLC